MIGRRVPKCLQSDANMYLDEQKEDSLHLAAMLADEYCLTHKSFEKSVDKAVSHQEGQNP